MPNLPESSICNGKHVLKKRARRLDVFLLYRNMGGNEKNRCIIQIECRRIELLKNEYIPEKAFEKSS